jgi:hypothetical protein
MAISVLILAAMITLALGYRSAYPGGKRVYQLYDSAGNGTNEPECSFRVADFQGGLHMGPCGPGERVNWGYTLYLSGSGERFSFDRIELESDDLLRQERPVGGDVLFDRNGNTLTISLKVAKEKNSDDFVGNGTFKIKKAR